MSYLDRHASKNEPFTKVLFYSVLVHYVFFYIFIGNPLLILTFDDPSSIVDHSIDIRLLSIPKMEEAPKEIRVPFPIKTGESSQAQANLSPVPAFPEGPVDKFEIGHEITEVEETASNIPLAADELPDFKEAVSSSTPTEESKKIVRKLPPNMTGPEDCLLKVVGMVCPSGAVECIAAYKEFCSSLRK